MADIQERIAGQFPEATFDTSDVLTVEIPDAKLHALARFLRDELHFDYLMTIVGMDWVEKMGCIYYLQSTADHNRIAIKATTRP